jgi:hypothetical protein
VPTTAAPLILSDPGYLFRAPLLSTEPTNTVAGSKFTDAWPVAWVSIGATEEGSTFGYQVNVEAVTVAEFLDPIAYKTVSRAGKLAFAMANYTLTNWQVAGNGGTLTIVSGTGATQLNKYEFPDPGSEVRSMLGYESLDGTFRIVMRQAINAVNIESAFKKAPSKALIPCEFQFEVPAALKPVSFYSAGVGRA